MVISSMAQTIFRAKTSRVNRAATAAASSDASAYCRDLDNWQRSWIGLERDLPPGEELVVCFRPFIEHLAASSLSSKTMRRHVDNLWILGGEIIRDLNYTPSLRKVAAQRLLREAVHADGGPLIHNCARRHTSMSRMKISDLRNWRRRWDSDSLHIKKRRNLPRHRPCGWLSAQSSHNSVFWPVIVTCPVHRA